MSPFAWPGISDALLYEGYLLYPYRQSALKNQFRWTIGCLLPKDWCDRHDPSERSSLRSECLIRGGPESVLNVRLRCLVLAPNLSHDAPSRPDTVERDLVFSRINLHQLINRPETFAFELISTPSTESLGAATTIVGRVVLQASLLADDLARLSVEVHNTTKSDTLQSDRDAALGRSLISTHLLLDCHQSAFVSLIEPPDDVRNFAEDCCNNGYWPFLSGAPGSHSQLIISPIILSDHPQIAPESAGDFFDSTEMDEMLAMRLRSLTDDEKVEVRETAPQARQILDRAEAFDSDDMQRMHGTVRPGMSSEIKQTLHSQPPTRVRIAGIDVQAGDRVRLNPKGRNDIFDLALAGRIATVESVQQDFEDTLYVAVTADDDPGRDFGRMGLPGHRFFFRLDEVEPLGTNEADEP